MRMGKYIVRRSINAVISLFLVLLLFSILLNTQLEVVAKEEISFNALSALANKHFDTPEQHHEARVAMTRAMEKSYQLDRPVLERIFNRAVKAMYLDFGNSRMIQTQRHSRNVQKIILESVPLTLVLFVFSSLLCVGISILLGVKKAQYANKPFDRITTVLTMLFFGMPSWVLGAFFIMWFVCYWPIFPFGRFYTTPPVEGAFMQFIDLIKHMILPVFAFVIARMWNNAFLIRNVMLEPMQQDYIMAARGRGLPERKILFGHALRAASPGIMTMSTLTVVGSFSGDIALEQVFNWPGIGTLLFRAVQMNDFPVMMGVVTMYTIIYLLALLIQDILYVYLDPRIQY